MSHQSHIIKNTIPVKIRSKKFKESLPQNKSQRYRVVQWNKYIKSDLTQVKV